jgi:ABC-type dipeptide/oligopeptide/nickel transport system ATPase component
MLNGEIVEAGDTAAVMKSPRQAFTAELVRDVTQPPVGDDAPGQSPERHPPQEAAG